MRGLKKEHEEFVLEIGPEADLDRLLATLSESKIRVDHFRVEEEPGEDARQVVMFLTLPTGQEPEEAAAALARIPGIRGVDWTR